MRMILAGVVVVVALLLVACNFVDRVAGVGRHSELARVAVPQANPGGKPVHHVSGGGVSISGPDTAAFNFNAKEHKGLTRGHASFVTNGNTALRAAIDCLTVNDNQAWLSGTIVESNTGLEGLPIVFRIVDNGEGHKTIDQITRPFIGTVETCLTQPAGILQPVVQGNIQVK